MLPLELLKDVLSELETVDLLYILYAVPRKGHPMFEMAKRFLYTDIIIYRPQKLPRFVETIIEEADLAENVRECNFWSPNGEEWKLATYDDYIYGEDDDAQQYLALIPIAIALIAKSLEVLTVPPLISRLLFERCSRAIHRAKRLTSLTIASPSEYHRRAVPASITRIFNIGSLCKLNLQCISFDDGDTIDNYHFPNVRYLCYRGQPNRQIHTAEALPFLNAFSNLIELEVAGPAQHLYDPEFQLFLRKHKSTLAHLTLDNSSGHKLIEDAPIALAGFTSLQSLRLYHMEVEDLANLPESISHLLYEHFTNSVEQLIRFIGKSKELELSISRTSFTTPELANLFRSANARGVVLDLAGSTIVDAD